MRLNEFCGLAKGGRRKPRAAEKKMFEKILLVDDDQVFRQELIASLDSYDIIEAGDGQEALLALSKPNEIGLLILDIKMPGLSGTDILKIAKKREAGIPVVMMTGCSSKETAIEALRGQADEYIEKPFNVAVLREAIERLLERKKYGSDVKAESEISRKISRVKCYIERNCFKRVTLGESARLVGLNPKYLSRIFKETEGAGFKEYELKVKIEKAKELLRNYGNTVCQVSDKLGFANPESFMRMFKKFTGLTPAEFRNIKKLKTKQFHLRMKKTQKN